MALEDPSQLELLKSKKKKFKNDPFRDSSGTYWASRREYDRWQHLRVCKIAELISDLKRQVRFLLVVNGIKIGVYVADFTYEHDGVKVVEDAKGYQTRVYKIKKRLMKALYSIEIKEV